MRSPPGPPAARLIAANRAALGVSAERARILVRPALKAVAELAPDRELAVAREITKVHEETLRGTAGALLERLTGPRLRGELVLLVRGKAGRPEQERET